jgi:hypothetical protein
MVRLNRSLDSMKIYMKPREYISPPLKKQKFQNYPKPWNLISPLGWLGSAEPTQLKRPDNIRR